jgi:flagellar L-ring protein precursor FlgH
MGFKQWTKTALVWGFLLLPLQGCSGSLGPSMVNHPPKVVMPEPVQPVPVKEEGSLWSSVAAASYFSDVKAGQVGDTITISIVESATASKNASTKTGRTSGLEASYSGVLDSMTAGISINGQKIGSDHKVDFTNNFDGSGATTRSSSMNAYITARVMQVLPNRNLVIRGTRQVRVNNENQWIAIQGVIRPEDITSGNVVLSTYIADARIELNGQGPVSDKQVPGWLARVLDWAWPF